MNLDDPVRWLARRGHPGFTLSSVFAAFALLYLRRPEAIEAAEFFAEEGTAFYVPTHFLGPELLVTPWAGYLQVAARSGYEVLRFVPVPFVPLGENLLAYALAAGVTAFGVWRFGPIALAVLVLPAASTVYPTLVNAQWFIALLLMMVAARPTGRGVEVSAAVVGAVSIGFALLVAVPFLLLRRWVAAAILAIGGLGQLALALASERSGVPIEWDILPAIALVRLAVVPILGDHWTAALQSSQPALLVGIGAAIGAALFVLAARAWPQLWPIVVVGVLVATAGLLTNWTGDFWDVEFGQRYFFLFGIAVAAVVIAGIARGDLLAIPLAVLLAAGVVGDFRLEPHPPRGWATHYGCIGAPTPCVIPVYPDRWTIDWPGSNAPFELPPADVPGIPSHAPGDEDGQP